MQRTVFVLGAGASHEINLPVGEELTKAVASLVDIRFEHGHEQISGDHMITATLRRHVQQTSPSRPDINPYVYAGWRIRDAMPLAASIDNFLDGHRSDERAALIGKLAIVRAILEAESRSGLYGDPTSGPDAQISLERVRGSWFPAFWQVLCNGCTADEFQERARSVAFISFNYDRCIEEFLYQSVRAYYGLLPRVAAEAVSSIEVFHPYGSVGRLPWQTGAGFAPVAYGSETHPEQLLGLSAGIRTFTESTEAGRSEEIAAAREWINTAERVVFLGFAYHYQNMRLLWPGQATETAGRHFYGTAHRISTSDVRAIVDEIAAYAGINATYVVLRNDLKCSELFHEYQHSLSMIERAQFLGPSLPP
jgi:hypothetical protein